MWEPKYRHIEQSVLLGFDNTSFTIQVEHHIHQVIVENAMLFFEQNVIRKGCIYTPSPMRILRLGMGKRCERCNTTKTNTINSLGLFLCRSCTNGIVSEIKFYEGRAEESCALVRAVIEDERCAKRVQRFRRKKRSRYSIYSGITQFVDGAGEK